MKRKLLFISWMEWMVYRDFVLQLGQVMCSVSLSLCSAAKDRVVLHVIKKEPYCLLIASMKRCSQRYPTVSGSSLYPSACESTSDTTANYSISSAVQPMTLSAKSLSRRSMAIAECLQWLQQLKPLAILFTGTLMSTLSSLREFLLRTAISFTSPTSGNTKQRRSLRNVCLIFYSLSIRLTMRLSLRSLSVRYLAQKRHFYCTALPGACAPGSTQDSVSITRCASPKEITLVCNGWLSISHDARSH